MTLPKKITDPKHIARFFNHLAKVDRVSFHPDDSFEGYGSGDPFRNWVRTYTKSESTVRNRLMKQAFRVARENGLDIYCIAMISLALATGDELPEDCEQEMEIFKPKKGVLYWRPDQS